LNKVEDFWEHRDWCVINFIKELFFDGHIFSLFENSD